MSGFTDDTNHPNPMCEHGVSKTNEICDKCLNKELDQTTPITPEFQAAIIEVLKQATKNKCVLMGFIMCGKPVFVSTISNTTQKAKEMVQLFHSYADLIQERTEEDVLTIDLTRPEEDEK
jgi:hypothetical protein